MQVAVERPAYDLIVFKIYCGRLALKIYTKGERALRIEAMANDARELRCGQAHRDSGMRPGRRATSRAISGIARVRGPALRSCSDT